MKLARCYVNIRQKFKIKLSTTCFHVGKFMLNFECLSIWNFVKQNRVQIAYYLKKLESKKNTKYKK